MMRTIFQRKTLSDNRKIGFLYMKTLSLSKNKYGKIVWGWLLEELLADQWLSLFYIFNRFWVEGVAITVVGVIGLAGNFLAVLVLKDSPSSKSFDRLLIRLTWGRFKKIHENLRIFTQSSQGKTSCLNVLSGKLPCPLYFWVKIFAEFTLENLHEKSAPGTDVMIFKIFSPKNSAKKLAFFTQNKAKLCKILIITLVFEKNANFFAENCRKSQKIVIITLVPGVPQ
jgi:hypothetical protein